MSTDDQFLPQPKVQKRYGVGGMSIWRWVNDEDLEFPKPIQIGKRNYFKLSDLEAWERKRAASRQPVNVQRNRKRKSV